ncbi:MAG TPA: glycosyltransferase family 9 protein [Steroidobacteraceae bacterium]|jgi:heptosyltransferase-2/heptosyltransferase-3|nr:glycosyltransferase family 9 protein [Steroidobacteraceae bacterium]
MTRPMVVRFGALGDMVLMTVAIRLLHRRFGLPVDVLASGAWTRPLLAGQPGVGEIYLLRSRRQPFWLDPDQWRLLRQLKKRGAGPTWLFDALKADKVRWLLQRAGWRPEQLLTVEELPHIRGEPFCERWRRFALLGPAPAGEAAPGASASDSAARDAADAVPRLRVPAQGRAELDGLLARHALAGRPLILVQAGNKRTMRRGSPRRRSNTKYWPEDRWAAVLRTLRSQHPEHALLLLGVTREAALNGEILALAQIADAHNMAGESSVTQLLALAERAFGLISVDTGSAHVAAAVGCPVLVLYHSPDAQRIYAARAGAAPAIHLTGGTDQGPSLLGLTPEQVMAGWRRLVAEREVAMSECKRLIL